MAYMQKPGRGSHPKTGHGIPSPLRQDMYKNIDAAELKSSGGKGVTMTADQVLNKYPAQNKHLRSNVQKNEKGETTGYTVEPNSKKAVEQIQIAKDSMSYISGAKNDLDRVKYGNDFSRNYSTNSKEGKKKAGGEYKGPGGVSASPESKRAVVSDLIKQSSNNLYDEDTPSKRFGIAKPSAESAKTNPISGKDKIKAKK